jgi:hypothetical protein
MKNPLQIVHKGSLISLMYTIHSVPKLILQISFITVFVLWRNHLISIMTLFWALIPPLWHPPVAIVPYYLYAIVEKFPVQLMPGHRNAPWAPNGGRVGARGEINTWKEDFSRAIIRGFCLSNESHRKMNLERTNPMRGKMKRKKRTRCRGEVNCVWNPWTVRRHQPCI